jgi:hypothetical protein
LDFWNINNYKYQNAEVLRTYVDPLYAAKFEPFLAYKCTFTVWNVAVVLIREVYTGCFRTKSEYFRRW